MGIGIGNPEEQTIIKKKERNSHNAQKFFINMNM